MTWRDWVGLALVVAFATVTTFWAGSVGLYLLALWCAVIWVYCIWPAKAA